MSENKIVLIQFKMQGTVEDCWLLI